MLLGGFKWVLEKQPLFKQMSVEAECHCGTEENRIKNNKLLTGFGSACIFILVNQTQIRGLDQEAFVAYLFYTRDNILK